MTDERPSAADAVDLPIETPSGPPADRLPIIPPIPVQQQASPGESPRPRRRTTVVALVVVAAVLVGAAVTAVVLGSAARPPAADPSAAPTTAAQAGQVRIPNLVGLTAAGARSELTKLGVADVSFAGGVSDGVVKYQNPTAGVMSDRTATVSLMMEPIAPPPTSAAPAPVALAPAKTLSAREWQVIAKNPDAHVGERVVVYGHITQFDTATGSDAFRANVDGVKHRRTYDYDTNTVLLGYTTQLSDFVVDDTFRAEVTVLGSYSYESTLGGNITVPQLRVDAIARL